MTILVTVSNRISRKNISVIGFNHGPKLVSFKPCNSSTIQFRNDFTGFNIISDAWATNDMCPLCDKVDETIDHLLVSCVFTRQIWYNILQLFGLQAVAPQMDNLFFVDWWDEASSRLSGQVQKGFNSIIILGAWLIWKHRNYCLWWRDP